MPEETASNFYEVLGIPPTSSVQQIRQAYRDLSKLYHPDTTKLPSATATAKFHQLNEAYATLSSPDRRSAYDLKIGYSRVSVIQPPVSINVPSVNSRRYRSSAYLDPSDRPLSAGELFAVFILGVTFIGCLLLVVAIGMTRGDIALQSLTPSQLSTSVKNQVQTFFDRSSLNQANNPSEPGSSAPPQLTAETLVPPETDNSPSPTQVVPTLPNTAGIPHPSTPLVAPTLQ